MNLICFDLEGPLSPQDLDCPIGVTECGKNRGAPAGHGRRGREILSEAHSSMLSRRAGPEVRVMGSPTATLALTSSRCQE